MRIKYFSFAMLLLFLVLQFSLSAQTLKKSETINVNGIDLYYEVYGEGEPIFLLHYWFATSQMWMPHVKELEKDFQVIIPDLRGHGKSSPDLSDFSFEKAAQDVFALMDYLNIPKMKGAGVSYGGFTLLHMATMHPEKVEAMIIVGAGFRNNEENQAWMKGWIKNTKGKTDWWKNFPPHANGEAQMEALLKQFELMSNDFNERNAIEKALLSTIQAKTLVVLGEYDALTIEQTLEMHRAIPKSNLWILPGAGHTTPVSGPYMPEFLRITEMFLK